LANSSYTGLDGFQFKLTDGALDSDVVTVCILSHGEPFDESDYASFPLMGDALYIGNGNKPDTHQIAQKIDDCWLVAAAAGLAANATQRTNVIPGIISTNLDATWD